MERKRSGGLLTRTGSSGNGSWIQFLLLVLIAFNTWPGAANNNDERRRENPQPAPVVSQAWVYVIEESAERTADAAKILNDIAYWRSLESRKLHYRIYDADNPKSQPFLTKAKEIGFPAVIIVDPGGAMLDGFSLPATTVELDQLIRSATGL